MREVWQRQLAPVFGGGYSRKQARSTKNDGVDILRNIGSPTSCSTIAGQKPRHHLAHGKDRAFLKASFRFRKCPREHYAAAACQQVLATVEVVGDWRT